jgi:hypothetical protein
MDELDLISRALPEARPLSPEVVAKARARVATAKAPRHRSRAWTWTWAGAAVGTAAVVGVVALVANMAEPPAPTLASQAKPNQALYDLADKVEKLPAEPPGRYWRESTQEVSGKHSSLFERWSARSADEPSALWRIYKGKCTGEMRDFDGRYPDTGLAELSMADVAALPSDPVSLKRKLREFHQVWYKRGFEQSFADFLPSAASLLSMPITPQVRATTLRILAEAPHTRTYGTAVDPMGRAGLLVSFAKAGDGGTIGKVPVYYQTFLGPSDGRQLSTVAKAVKGGRVESYNARLPQSGWTDERPPMPKGCKPSR